jgi:hypothetical protein
VTGSPREHQESQFMGTSRSQPSEHPDTKLRRLRTEAFTALMAHWQRIDDRQRRTWLALLIGYMSESELVLLKNRLSQKRGNVCRASSSR